MEHHKINLKKLVFLQNTYVQRFYHSWESLKKHFSTRQSCRRRPRSNCLIDYTNIFQVFRVEIRKLRASNSLCIYMLFFSFKNVVMYYIISPTIEDCARSMKIFLVKKKDGRGFCYSYCCFGVLKGWPKVILYYK